MCITKKQIANYWVNHGGETLLLFFIVLVNIILIAERFWYYTAGPGAPYSINISRGVAVARSTAAAIRFDCGLILITVLRNFLSWVRGTWVGTYIPIDKNRGFHIGLAWAIALLTSLHTAGHMINFYNMAYVTPAAVLIQLNILEQGEIPKTPWEWAFTTLPGTTGMITVLAMIFMYSTALESVRRPMFEGFWFTHHLFVLFFVLMCVHGISGMLEPAQFWMWVIGPCIFYIIERIIRRVRGSQKTIILQAYQHPSKVLEIRMKKASFLYQPGQYLFLSCSYIADFEWHPFTISSCPEEDYLSVHIRVAGDWTGKLSQLLNPQGLPGIVQENMHSAPNGKPILEIDGPFGTASEDVWKFETIMLFAAGIGVTPFASILKSIKYKIENDTCLIKNVEFYWTNRDQQCFEWFLDLLAYLEKHCPFLEINLYFTGNLDPEQVRAYMQEKPEDTSELEGGDDPDIDPITLLQTRTTFGRPDIGAIFATKAVQFHGKMVGVFFCGPPVLGKSILKSCERHTSVTTNTRFIYHKENF